MRRYCCFFPDEFCGNFELSRSFINLGVPRPNVLFLTVALSICSAVVGLLLFHGGVSGSLSDSIMNTFFCFDDLVWSSRSCSSVVVAFLITISDYFTNTFPMYYSTIRCGYCMFCSRYCYIWFIGIGTFKFRFLMFFLRKGMDSY